MDQIVVKTEVQGNGELILYFVDENGTNQEGVVTTIENIENDAVQFQENSYILEEHEYEDEELETNEQETESQWTQEDIKRLLIFYNDNKQSFISGSTKKIHLWTVACKTMLIGKTPNCCDTQLQLLKNKYMEIRGMINKSLYVKWPYFDICHQAFHDDAEVLSMVEKWTTEPIRIVKQVNSKSLPDAKVETMLNLYLKLKYRYEKVSCKRDLWNNIALEMGEDTGEYWQKRFYSYKQHYINLLEKRKEGGHEAVSWPYMHIFDKIFEDDIEFLKKYAPDTVVAQQKEAYANINNWNVTEKTVLVKYCFDCFDEFQDPTIPNNFLWTEIGRLLDKKPEACQSKYEEMKEDHFDSYISNGYSIRSRKPMSIIYDNIIAKEVQIEFTQTNQENTVDQLEQTDDIDKLVLFFYENVVMFKDPICHFVCWAAIARKLNTDISKCKRSFDDLLNLYKSILNDKKENSDMQIDWRYIDLFDRIYDYGMDQNLLTGYDKSANSPNTNDKIGVKKVSIVMKDDNKLVKADNHYEDSLLKRHFTETESSQVLEYYLKNKDKFALKSRKKEAAWNVLARRIGATALECSNEFRNLRKLYMEFVQKEINRPKTPILWPLYNLCKKVFGYRAIKSKLKSGIVDCDTDAWSDSNIKKLIQHFAKNFDLIDNNVEDTSKWNELAFNIDKTEIECKEKFLELRKSFRKLKTMKSRNPDVRISWAYYNIFEQIYNAKENSNAMEVDITYLDMEDKTQQDEEDYQCIIVLPEGQDISDIENAQIKTGNYASDHNNDISDSMDYQSVEINVKPNRVKWTRMSKKNLLIHYINYVRLHRDKDIKTKEMWAHIAAKYSNQTPPACRKMFIRLKNNYKNAAEATKINSPYNNLLKRVMLLNPKFVKAQENKTLQSNSKTYKDVPLADDKVVKALQYYLEHIEDFVSPKFEKKYLWTELANFIAEPVSIVYNKINYLKQAYNMETEEVDGVKTPFSDLIKDIIAKEVAVKIVLEVNSDIKTETDNAEESWTDEETKQLLEWYLSNLDKFKNPKFVRSYLWMEASTILLKSPLVCSKKMSEIRTQYKTMMRENFEELNTWRFYDLCQKIYGTGKRNVPAAN